LFTKTNSTFFPLRQIVSIDIIENNKARLNIGNNEFVDIDYKDNILIIPSQAEFNGSIIKLVLESTETNTKNLEFFPKTIVLTAGLSINMTAFSSR
jgi:hypothetical protein